MRKDDRMTTDLGPIPLRWYSKPAIGAAASALMGRAQAGVLSQLDLAQAMLAFCFRDEQGIYWFLTAPSGQWYRLGSTDWEPANEVPEMLEGPEGLPTELDLPAKEQETTATPPSASPPKALNAAVAVIRAAYAQGQANNLETRALLAQRILIDRQGRVWTVGAQSGQWYVFEQGDWTRAVAPPEPGTLARLQAPPEYCPSCGQPVQGTGICPHCGAAVPPMLEGVADEAYAPILDFLTRHSDSLPEAVTAPWVPPPAYPNVEIPLVSRLFPLVAPEAMPPPAPEPEPPAPTTRARWFLQVITGTTADQQIELSDRLRIGRAPDNDLHLANAGVSRYHAVIERDGDGYTIADLGSTNGTVVNGQRISGPTLLQSGDTIALHEVRFTLTAEGAPARCSNCGEPVRSNVRFCPQCGARLA
jgi:ribosomal protein L32